MRRFSITNACCSRSVIPGLGVFESCQCMPSFKLNRTCHRFRFKEEQVDPVAMSDCFCWCDHRLVSRLQTLSKKLCWAAEPKHRTTQQACESCDQIRPPAGVHLRGHSLALSGLQEAGGHSLGEPPIGENVSWGLLLPHVEGKEEILRLSPH